MSMRSVKKTVRRLLAEEELEKVAELSVQGEPVLGVLMALTFDPEPVISWRAVEAMGITTRRMSHVNRPQVMEHVRRLFWLITEESGAVFWRSPECLAECAAQNPVLLRDFIPIAFHLVETLEPEDLEHFRPGTLWAVARLAELADEKHVDTVLPLVEDALDEEDPQARGMAVWALGRLGREEILRRHEGTLEDRGEFLLYRDREVGETTVGDLAREVLEKAPSGTA